MNFHTMLMGVNNFNLKKSRLVQFQICFPRSPIEKMQLEPIITQFIDAYMRQQTTID